MSTPQDPFAPPPEGQGAGNSGAGNSGAGSSGAGSSAWRPQDADSRPGPPAQPGGDRGGAPGTAAWGPPEQGQYGAPPYGTSPYGAPGGAGYGPPQRRNGLGTAALVLGILALLLSWTIVGGVVLGLAAVVLGVLGRGRVKRREADNGGSAVAGIVLGLVGLVIAIGLVALGAAFFSSEQGRTLTECLREAGNDPAAQEQCLEQAQQ
jgi:hypothetical protein